MSTYKYKNYQFFIGFEELFPPIHKDRYAAKVARILRIEKNKDKNTWINNNDLISEALGETEEKAENALKEKIRKWTDKKTIE